MKEEAVRRTTNHE